MSSSQTHVAVNASFVVLESPADKRIESNFVAMAECAMIDQALPITAAEDNSMRYEITFKNWKCEEILEGMFIEGQGFLHVDYDDDGTPRLRFNMYSARM